MTCSSCLVTNRTQDPDILSKQGLASLPGRPQLAILFPKWGQRRLFRVSSQKAKPSSSCYLPASLLTSSLS